MLDEDGEAGKSDDNKPGLGDLPTIRKKPRASPSSLSSDVTELSLLRREQMDKNDNNQKMQFGLEQRKVELLEQEESYVWLRSKCSSKLTSCGKGHSYSEKVYRKMRLIGRCLCLAIIKHSNFLISKQILLLLEILIPIQIDLTVCPYPIVVNTTQPPHFNPCD